MGSLSAGLVGTLLLLAMPVRPAAASRPVPAGQGILPSPPGIGLEDADLTDAVRQQAQLPRSLTGVPVTALYRTGPAAGSGVRVGDIVFAVDGQPVTSRKAFGQALRQYESGDTVTLSIWRAGEGIKLKVTLAPRMTYAPASCEAGSAAACCDLGEAYAKALGVVPDLPRARQMRVKACQLGWAPSCFDAAFMAEKGQGGPKDSAAAVVLYRRGCPGELAACVNLGIMYAEGDGTRRDVAAAAAAFREACDRSFEPGCNALAELRRVERVPALAIARTAPDVAATRTPGAGVEIPEPAASRATPDDPVAEGLRKACNAGDAAACVKSADMLADPRRTTSMDRAVAMTAYARACEVGAAKGCVEAGRAFAAGDGVLKDLELSNRLYIRGCEALGDGRCCTRAALQLAEGQGVPKDTARALGLLELGCRAGDQTACDARRKFSAANRPPGLAP